MPRLSGPVPRQRMPHGGPLPGRALARRVRKLRVGCGWTNTSTAVASKLPVCPRNQAACAIFRARAHSRLGHAGQVAQPQENYFHGVLTAPQNLSYTARLRCSLTRPLDVVQKQRGMTEGQKPVQRAPKRGVQWLLSSQEKSLVKTLNFFDKALKTVS